MKRRHENDSGDAPRSVMSKAAKERLRDENIITKLAQEHWPDKDSFFDSSVITNVYNDLLNSGFPQHKASKEHILCMVLMINEKFLEAQDPLRELSSENNITLTTFLETAFSLASHPQDLCFAARTQLIILLIRCFQSIVRTDVENDAMRTFLQPYISLNTWHCLLDEQREEQFAKYPKLAKGWKKLNKRLSKLSSCDREAMMQKHLFVFNLIDNFRQIIESIDNQSSVDYELIRYCERFLEFLVDLEALLITRRYLNTVISACDIVSVCHLSALYQMENYGHLFRQLVEMLRFYVGFEIDEFSGEPLTDDMMTKRHYTQMHRLQVIAFKLFRDKLEDFAFSHISGIDAREELSNYLDRLSDEELRELCMHLRIAPPSKVDDATLKSSSAAMSRPLIIEALCMRFTRRLSQLDSLNEMPLFPTEKVLWDENIVPTESYSNECLALPKLNLQFLTMFDYLLRNLNLFNMESVYEIRLDFEEHLPRMRPYTNQQGVVCFAGWSRMGLPIQDFAVVQVSAPRVGENHPASVRADMTLNLSLPAHIRQEWENLRHHDVGFLISIHPPMNDPSLVDQGVPFLQQYGIVAIRGCEVEGMLDVDGQVIEERPDIKPKLPRGDNRTFRLILDPNQYQLDLDNPSSESGDIYSSFNVFIRRNPKENNFKAVLETIRDLMNSQCVVPEWLHDTFLGYGDPGAAHYSRLSTQKAQLNFHDTFLDLTHVHETFPEYEVNFEYSSAGESSKPKPPFVVTFPINMPSRKIDSLVPRSVAARATSDLTTREIGMDINKDASVKKEEEIERKHLIVKSLPLENRGPFPVDVPRQNLVRFTPAQVEAIRSGMQPGLTLVVGPPGTGKTDVAVQIIANLYRNEPDQRTLIVTHSNQALNQLFEKLMHLDIEERHLLRLGRGEELLETTKDFSRYGRVDFVLQHRLQLLEEVQLLALSIGYPTDVASTCETCGHFFHQVIEPMWKSYFSSIDSLDISVRANADATATIEAIAQIAQYFPFTEFFKTAPQPLFKGENFDEDWDMAMGCMKHIRHVFETLEEYRPFEQVHRGRDRSKYLLTKEAKIVAMTCTHAALTRRELVKLGFKYDNVIMEEAAQILEVETFIPLMLQNTEDQYNRLKRVVLIGDHHQLPPVIKNMAFKKFSNMEQSLFTRFIRLGVPHVLLDKQGRMRPSLANLFRWNYHGLGDLNHVVKEKAFCIANPGLRFEFQLIDVGSFQGIGESVPSPHFIQNLAEAEYVVAVYMYMRLLGYPSSKITILTTYNGQKALINDVIRARCVSHPLFGPPSKIETVDKYQGSQNDYVLLSLVRTRSVGFLRDVRRLVVAMSRARLGLYVFARASLFKKCKELSPVFTQLLKRPTQLHLYPNEVFGETTRTVTDTTFEPTVVKDMPHMAQSVYNMAITRLQTMNLGSHTPSIPAPPLSTTTEQVDNEEGNVNEEEDSQKGAIESGDEPQAKQAKLTSDASADANSHDKVGGDTLTDVESQGDIKIKAEDSTKAILPDIIQAAKNEQNDVSSKSDLSMSVDEDIPSLAAAEPSVSHQTVLDSPNKVEGSSLPISCEAKSELSPDLTVSSREGNEPSQANDHESTSESPKSINLTVQEINAMRVVDLKEALRLNDITFSSTARKKELRETLLKAKGN